MKPRRVVITLEVETDRSIAYIRSNCDKLTWDDGSATKIEQVQINVIKAKKGAKKK